MENSTKIIIANNLKASERFGDSLVEGAICLTDLENKEIQKLSFEYEGKTYLKIKVVKRQAPTKFGKTHYLEIDQFVPQKQTDSTPKKAAKKTAKKEKVAA